MRSFVGVLLYIGKPARPVRRIRKVWSAAGTSWYTVPTGSSGASVGTGDGRVHRAVARREPRLQPFVAEAVRAVARLPGLLVAARDHRGGAEAGGAVRSDGHVAAGARPSPPGRTPHPRRG